MLQAERDPTGQGYRLTAVLDDAITLNYAYRFNEKITATNRTTSAETTIGGDGGQSNMAMTLLSSLVGGLSLGRSSSASTEDELAFADAQRDMPYVDGGAGRYQGPVRLTARIQVVRTPALLIGGRGLTARR